MRYAKICCGYKGRNLSLDKCSAANEIICRISENKFKEALNVRPDYYEYE